MTEAADHGQTAPKFLKDRSSYAAALQAWFAQVVPGAANVEITDLHIPVATGFSNETVLFHVYWTLNGEAQSERFVGRIEPPDGGLFPAQNAGSVISVQVQQRSMAAVAAHTDVPVPSVLAYESDPSVLGQPFFVMRFVDGVVPGDQPRYSQSGFLVDEATPDQRRDLVLSGLGAMAKIHNMDWTTAGLEWLNLTGDGTPTTLDHIKLYRGFVSQELRGRSHPVLEAALDWLEANDPHDQRIGLSWGDSRLGNIIWSNYSPAAVVDWEACAICATEADVGWWLMFDRMSFDEMAVDRMEGFPTRDEMIAHYESVSGREVRNPHYWEVFAVMRFCAIFIRLADRMVAAGVVPEVLNMSIANQVTSSLAVLLEIPNPTPAMY